MLTTLLSSRSNDSAHVCRACMAFMSYISGVFSCDVLFIFYFLLPTTLTLVHSAVALPGLCCLLWEYTGIVPVFTLDTVRTWTNGAGTAHFTLARKPQESGDRTNNKTFLPILHKRHEPRFETCRKLGFSRNMSPDTGRNYPGTEPDAVLVCEKVWFGLEGCCSASAAADRVTSGCVFALSLLFLEFSPNILSGIPVHRPSGSANDTNTHTHTLVYSHFRHTHTHSLSVEVTVTSACCPSGLVFEVTQKKGSKSYALSGNQRNLAHHRHGYPDVA